MEPQIEGLIKEHKKEKSKLEQKMNDMQTSLRL